MKDLLQQLSQIRTKELILINKVNSSQYKDMPTLQKSNRINRIISISAHMIDALGFYPAPKSLTFYTGHKYWVHQKAPQVVYKERIFMITPESYEITYRRLTNKSQRPW